MHKDCNSVVRIFSLTPSDVVDEYMEEYYNGNSVVDEDYVVSCGDIVIVKIGYDSDKKPLYKILIGDGARPIKDLGYVVPPNTIPTYDIGEIEDPMCLGEMIRNGITFNEDNEVVYNEETCDRFCPYIDDYGDQEDDTDDDDSMEVIAKNNNESYVVREKRDEDGNLLIRTTDIRFD